MTETVYGRNLSILTSEFLVLRMKTGDGHTWKLLNHILVHISVQRNLETGVE